MKIGKITIHERGVRMDKNVWMADFEIAELFAVTYAAVRRGIKTIYKNGAVKEQDTYRFIRLADEHCADVYNLTLITALAFQFDSPPALRFRVWLEEKMVATIKKDLPPFPILPLKGKAFHC